MAVVVVGVRLVPAEPLAVLAAMALLCCSFLSEGRKMKWARIQNNIAVEVVDFDPTGLFHPSIIWTQVADDCTSGARLQDGVWVDAPVVAPPPVFDGTLGESQITRLAFRNRFTTAEKVALEIAGLDNPAATMPERAQAAALRANQADLAAATFVDLARPDTRAGVQMLEAAGLLSPGRVLEILDAPVTPLERPQ